MINPASVQVPDTYIVDTQSVYSTDVNSLEFKELMVRLFRNLNQLALAVNQKESCYYNLLEFVSGKRYFPNPAYNSTTTTAARFRDVLRITLNAGALPNAGVKTIPHGIEPIGLNAGFTFTHIYATASNTAAQDYIPIPYSSPTLNQNIALSVDGTNVYITTAIDYSAYNVTYIVLEYMRT